MLQQQIFLVLAAILTIAYAVPLGYGHGPLVSPYHVGNIEDGSGHYAAIEGHYLKGHPVGRVWGYSTQINHGWQPQIYHKPYIPGYALPYSPVW